MALNYDGALLTSTTRYGAGSEREGFLSPRSAATKKVRKIAQAPQPMAPDDETLVPAPSVTGEARGPGGTEGVPTRGPQLPPPDSEYGTPFVGNQADIDFQAQQAIDKRALLRLRDIKEEEALRGNPQEAELRARQLTHELENYQQPGRSHIKFSPGGGVPLMDYADDLNNAPPPEAPNIGDIRARRAASVEMDRNPSVATARLHEQADSDREAKAARILQIYRSDVAKAKMSGDPNLDETLQNMENDLNRRFAALGLKPPTLVDPRRVSAP